MDDNKLLKLIGKLQFVRDYECKTGDEVKAMCEAIRIISESPAQEQPDKCRIYGGVCCYPIEACSECPKHEEYKRPCGHWIESETDGFVCSECRNGYRNQPTLMGKPIFEYCPVCGAYMGEVKSDGKQATSD